MTATPRYSVKLIPPLDKLTAEGWSIFSDMKGAEKAAQKLNSALAHALTVCKTEAEVRALVDPLRESLWRFGAMDSEPTRVVRAYCNAAFAAPEDRAFAVDEAAGPPPYI